MGAAAVRRGGQGDGAAAGEGMGAGRPANCGRGEPIPCAKGYLEADCGPVAEHVADFGAMLAAKGDTPAHVALALAHVRRGVALVGAVRLSDLSADAVRKAVAAIRDEGLALRTCNAILRSVKTFAGWLEGDGRIRHNDLRAVGGYKADTDRRRVRRDISDDELGRIIAAARERPRVFRDERRGSGDRVPAGGGDGLSAE